MRPKQSRSKPKRKWSTYLPVSGMIVLVVAAIATPSAAAVDMLPDDRAGAIALVLGVAILLTTLVVEVWRQTARNSMSELQRSLADHKAHNRRRATRID